MKTEININNKGVIKMILNSEHEFKESLMESIRRDNYQIHADVIREHDSFGGFKDARIQIEFKLKDK